MSTDSLYIRSHWGLGYRYIALYSTSHLPAIKVRALFFFSFAAVWTAIVFISTFHEYSSLATAKKNGNVHVAEGVVTNFKPMPVTDHAMERFCVSAACVECSDYVVTSGFNNTSSHGGPIREALPVRVTYFGNSILKFEVAE